MKTIVEQFLPARLLKNTIITCDDCGKEASRPASCGACGKDLCWHCQVCWWANPFSGDDAGDHPEKVCKDCDDAVHFASEECSRINEEAYQRVSKLEADFRESRRKR